MISNIWIISRSGVPLLSVNYREMEVHDNLIVGFLTALQAFAKETTRVNIESVRIGTNRLTFTIREDVMTVINSEPTDNELVVRKVLRDLTNEFRQRYDGRIDSSGGEVSVFEEFREVIDQKLINEDLVIRCSTCGKVIVADFIRMCVQDEARYYCCQSCKTQDTLNMPKNIDVMKDLELRCGVCGRSVPLPQHCGYPMSPDDDELVCWMGRDCKVLEFPEHCGVQLRIELKV